MEEKRLIPNCQFRHSQQHSTIDQVHLVTDIYEQALDERNVCSALLLDVTGIRKGPT